MARGTRGSVIRCADLKIEGERKGVKGTTVAGNGRLEEPTGTIDAVEKPQDDKDVEPNFATIVGLPWHSVLARPRFI